jgi:hypothetical protein
VQLKFALLRVLSALVEFVAGSALMVAALVPLHAGGVNLASELSRLTLPEGHVQALENGGHLLSVGLLFLELLILLIIDNVLFHTIFELILILRALHIRIGHDSHDLFIIIQNGQSWQLRLVIQKCLVCVH